MLHLRSAHKVFCAGADLALIPRQRRRACRAGAHAGWCRPCRRVFARLEQLPCLTLAELGGATLGGGFELALAYDWRIAANEARVGLPKRGLGLLLAAGGGTQRLTRCSAPAWRGG